MLRDLFYLLGFLLRCNHPVQLVDQSRAIALLRSLELPLRLGQLPKYLHTLENPLAWIAKVLETAPCGPESPMIVFNELSLRPRHAPDVRLVVRPHTQEL